MTTENKSVLFDPGFAQYTSILSLNTEYIYASINQFKNFGQKKMKFKMIYPQLINIVDNNIGFYLGCLLWAIYIKNNENALIQNNPCLNGEYNEEETLKEIDYSIKYFEQLKKDAKYYLNLDYKINPDYIKTLEIYKEFITLNQGFVNTKTTSDIIIPKVLKTPEQQDLEKIYNSIQTAVKTGELVKMFEVYNLIYEG